MWPDDEDYIAEIDGVGANEDLWLEHFAQADRSPKGEDAEERLHAEHESAVGNADAPNHGQSDNQQEDK
jgi:hypothetical protein